MKRGFLSNAMISLHDRRDKFRENILRVNQLCAPPDNAYTDTTTAAGAEAKPDHRFYLQQRPASSNLMRSLDSNQIQRQMTQMSR